MKKTVSVAPIMDCTDKHEIYFLSLISKNIHLSFFIILIAFFGFAIGLIFKNQPIKGSCGGMANLDEGSACEICGRTDPQSCKD